MTQVIQQATSTEILNHVFQYRRLIAGPDGGCADTPCAECRAPHEKKVQKYIDAGEPIHFVIPAFPAKSPNETKVLGALPDMGERLALEFLQSFCDHLAHYHAPGARVTICSDGHVFADVVGVSDDDATSYRSELEAMVASFDGSSVGFYALVDAYGSTDYDTVRTELMEHHAESLESLKHRSTLDEQVRGMFNGIHRFMFEDRVAVNPGKSRTKIREEAKPVAWEVIRRSNAWSRLVADTFPDALRLSIHPQPVHSEKIGFHLVRTRDRWLTPWHGVALETGDGMFLTKRSHAEELKASLVWRKNRPSHFVAPHLTLQEVMS
ncbi:isocyanide synthase family protein [Streptomyces zagrosensis]|uniref:Pyoverdine/dityrosine biosynthesis protein Dit1 n=1 Tax=Streptomyces zagrosensis TaxID=1042984 RepID=A0A7W9QI37_9ACTN|nr:isocyanide synthase family protein [Streptomyces zagrosensis]MBB5939642.1 pyoverdine/dityrosine biosynthesis protein Dit1 [Streptomyces zagrosensis]